MIHKYYVRFNLQHFMFMCNGVSTNNIGGSAFCIVFIEEINICFVQILVGVN